MQSELRCTEFSAHSGRVCRELDAGNSVSGRLKIINELFFFCGGFKNVLIILSICTELSPLLFIFLIVELCTYLCGDSTYIF